MYLEMGEYSFDLVQVFFGVSPSPSPTSLTSLRSPLNALTHSNPFPSVSTLQRSRFFTRDLPGSAGL